MLSRVLTVRQPWAGAICFAAKRVATRNTHGTGCTLSAAIAALLPRSGSVPEAVVDAKRWLTEAIRRSGELSVGQGHGPVHHFHTVWPSPSR